MCLHFFGVLSGFTVHTDPPKCNPKVFAIGPGTLSLIYSRTSLHSAIFFEFVTSPSVAICPSPRRPHACATTPGQFALTNKSVFCATTGVWKSWLFVFFNFQFVQLGDGCFLPTVFTVRHIQGLAHASSRGSAFKVELFLGHFA